MKKLALLFPGQGSQYVGMGKDLYNQYKVARDTFEEANEILGFDLKSLCFNGEIDELTKTQNTQPAILITSIAAYRVFNEQFGINPSYLAGHSLGEISALCCSGAINFCDAVKIARKRGEFMDKVQGKGGMISIGRIDYYEIDEQCEQISDDSKLVTISAYNSPEQIVVSGHIDALKVLTEKMQAQGAKVTPLKVKTPFHTILMKDSAKKLEEELKKYEFNEIMTPVISNALAIPYSGKEEIISNLTYQIVKPVEWAESMRYLYRSGVTTAIELGPKTVLRNLMKYNASNIKSYSFDVQKDVDSLIKDLEVKQDKLKVITMCLTAAICTKNNNLNNTDEYRNNVINPYMKIEALRNELEQSGEEPTDDQLKAALDMLHSVFKAKNTSSAEAAERLEEIMEQTGTRDILKAYI